MLLVVFQFFAHEGQKGFKNPNPSDPKRDIIVATSILYIESDLVTEKQQAGWDVSFSMSSEKKCTGIHTA